MVIIHLRHQTFCDEKGGFVEALVSIAHDDVGWVSDVATRKSVNRWSLIMYASALSWVFQNKSLFLSLVQKLSTSDCALASRN